MDKEQEDKLFEALKVQDKQLKRLEKLVYESTIPKHPPGLPDSHYFRLNPDYEEG